MPTINQLIRHGRERQTKKTTTPIMGACPQKRGVCLSVTTTSPKNLTPRFVKSQGFAL